MTLDRFVWAGLRGSCFTELNPASPVGFVKNATWPACFHPSRMCRRFRNLSGGGAVRVHAATTGRSPQGRMRQLVLVRGWR